MVREAGVDSERLLGVGLACPGPIDGRRRAILEAPNLIGWHDVPAGDILEAALQVPVIVENDANAAAIGEKWVGAARGMANFLYIYLGVGVGGAVFLDHQIYRGCSGNAGAIGHMAIETNGRPCSCGNRGCLETLCSEQAIVDRGRTLPGRSRDRLGVSFASGTTDDQYEAIASAAAAGNKHAVELIAVSAEYLAGAVTSLVNILDVDHVVLGGPALMVVGPIYLDSIRAAITQQPIARRAQNVSVAQSSLERLAAPIGAASLIFHEAYAPHLDGQRQAIDVRRYR